MEGEPPRSFRSLKGTSGMEGDVESVTIKIDVDGQTNMLGNLNSIDNMTESHCR